MSNIHNLEPQAHGLIVLKTTFGDIEVELFTKQCPKNTRNFVQLCLDGYYDGSVFDRVEKDFIAIGGELDLPGSECLNIETAPDEFHSRLKFSRRGLLATANTEKDLNGPKFFFTLGPAPELQNKHTIFGRVVGDSVYHLVDLNDCNVSEDLLPISEKKIIQVIVKENPYPELGVRPEFSGMLSELRGRDKLDDDETYMDASSGEYLEPKFDFKNAKKLSFYEDSEDDNEESSESKSTQKAPADERPQTSIVEHHRRENSKRILPEDNDSEPEPETESDAVEAAREKKLREIREQIRNLKKKLESESASRVRKSSHEGRDSHLSGNPSDATQDIKTIVSKRATIVDPDLPSSDQESRLARKKGYQRERETIELVTHFKKRLKGSTSIPDIAQRHRSDGRDEKEEDDKQYLDDVDDIEQALDLADGDEWLHHKFDAKDDPSSSMAKDANTKGDDWYSIDDPRNPIKQRVELERAREYKRHKERARHRDDIDSYEKDHRSKHRHRHHR